MDIRTCIEESFYAVTYGRSYEVFGTNPRNPHQIRVKSDRGRRIWIPAIYFAEGEISVPMIEHAMIKDDLNDHQHSAIEVDLLLTSGEWRWCYFASPAGLAQFGDTLDDNTTRIHYDTPHTIVVSPLDASTILTALNHIQRRGALLRCTRAFDPQDRDETSDEHNDMEPQ
jgi:hypothetical protein